MFSRVEYPVGQFLFGRLWTDLATLGQKAISAGSAGQDTELTSYIVDQSATTPHRINLGDPNCEGFSRITAGRVTNGTGFRFFGFANRFRMFFVDFPH